MLSTITLLAALAPQASPTANSQQFIEAVRSASALAAPDFTGQDYIGFNPGAPAMVGGLVQTDDTLAWQVSYPTDHMAQMYFGAQKNAFPFVVIIEDNEGSEVYRSAKNGMTQEVSFQPKPNEQYIVVVQPEITGPTRTAQVVGILGIVGRGMEFKPSQFVSTAQKLVREARPSISGSGFVDGMNCFAVPLMAGTAAGFDAQEAGRTQLRNTMVVVNDGRASSFKAELRTPDEALVGSSRRQGLAQALRITVDVNATGHHGALLHLTNTSKSHSLFMGAIAAK